MAYSRCPHCQARLKIPDERLHSKVRCPKCSEPFVCESDADSQRSTNLRDQPRASLRRRPARKSNSLSIVLACIALATVGLIWAFYPAPPAKNTLTQAEEIPMNQVAAPSPQIAASEHPAMKRVRFFSQTILARNFQSLANQLDLPTWYKARNPNDNRLYQLLPDDEVKPWRDSMLLELAEHPLILQFVQDSYTDVFYLDTDKVPLRIEIRTTSSPDTRWVFDFTQDSGKWKISNLEVTPPPSPVEVVKVEDAKPKKSEIYIEDNLGGRIFRGKIEKVDLVQGTSSEDLSQLNTLLEAALQDGGLESRVAKKELIHWENKPIPLLLNRMASLPLDGSEDRLMEVAAIDGLLQALTHRISTLPMRALGTGGKVGLLERQNEVLGSWFTWWKVWGKKWDGWKKEANFPPPPRIRGGNRRNNRSGRD